MKFCRILIILLVLGSLFWVACGGKPTTPQKVYSPDWYGLTPSNDTHIIVYGHGVGDKRGSEILANNRARATATSEVETQLNETINTFCQQAGVDLAEISDQVKETISWVINQRFHGTETTKTEEKLMANGEIQTWLEISIPREAIDKTLVDRIKNNDTLYSRFKDTQAFLDFSW